MVEIPGTNLTQQNIELINAVKNPTYPSIKDNVLLVAELCNTKAELQQFFDKLNENVIILIAKALNQESPEKIQTGSQARNYIKHRFNRDTLETIRKRLNGEIITDATQTGEMSVLSARLETVHEPLGTRLKAWLNRLLGKPPF